jgi:pimeloyl-ACP methyl ester carboxylesterase
VVEMNRRPAVIDAVRRMRLLAGLCLAVGLLLSGCVTQMLATRIVAAPNRDGLPRPFRDPKVLAGSDAFYIEIWRSAVGPPTAELAVGVIEPANYHLTYDMKANRDADGKGEFTFNFNCKFLDKDGKRVTSAEPPKATLVLLHGIMMTKEAMMPWAIYFAQQGYRVVLVDLRGHGRSTGKWIGYGAWEADDLVKVADELQRRGLLAGKLGVFGESYGAAVGIHWAARDPRVATVVALAPFSDPRTAIAGFARGFSPKLAAKLSDETFAKAEAQAAAMAGFAWNDVNVVEAMKRVRVPVLFFHGKFDTWILPAHTEMLQQAAPAGSRREVTPQDDHITLMMRLDLLGPQALAWFDERLRDSAPTGPVADGYPPGS